MKLSGSSCRPPASGGLALPVGLSASPRRPAPSAVVDEAGCFVFSSVSAVIKVDCLAKECPTTISVAHARRTSRGLSCELDLTPRLLHCVASTRMLLGKVPHHKTGAFTSPANFWPTRSTARRSIRSLRRAPTCCCSRRTGIRSSSASGSCSRSPTGGLSAAAFSLARRPPDRAAGCSSASSALRLTRRGCSQAQRRASLGA